MDNHDFFDLGLQADLVMARQSPLTRRDVLKLGIVGISALMTGCASPTTIDSIGACLNEIPTETAGPYPADGSQASNQSLNALALLGIVRSDIRTSLGTGNVADGIPCTIELTLVNTNADCAPLTEHALYLWHCNREGNYSMYSTATVDEDYLRGVQVSDSDGKVSFTSIFPACYAGRMLTLKSIRRWKKQRMPAMHSIRLNWRCLKIYVTRFMLLKGMSKVSRIWHRSAWKATTFLAMESAYKWQLSAEM